MGVRVRVIFDRRGVIVVGRKGARVERRKEDRRSAHRTRDAPDRLGPVEPE